MTAGEWMDLTVLERRKYNDLTEALDLTRQLGESMDRSDQVAVRMIIAMRQDPLLRLEETEKTLKDRRRTLSEEDQERVKALLKGEEPRSSQERTFLEQAGKTRRLLERVVELDRRISLRMAGGQSFYKKN